MIIKTSIPKAIWKAKTVLGEGILWVSSQKSIFFVDIKKKKILIFNIRLKKKTTIRLKLIIEIKKRLLLWGVCRTSYALAGINYLILFGARSQYNLDIQM